MFNPTRLTLARKRRGMTKIGLADATGLSTRSVSAYEAGTQKPTSETVEALSRALRFPIEFFDGADLDEPTAESASFRAYASMTARQRDAALAAGTIALELSIWIDRRFDLPKPNIPNLRGFVPEVAAQALREHWGIGERPIRNSIHLLEAQGVRVFSLVQECVELNAFSLWKAGLPTNLGISPSISTADHGGEQPSWRLTALRPHSLCPPAACSLRPPASQRLTIF